MEWSGEVSQRNSIKTLRVLPGENACGNPRRFSRRRGSAVLLESQKGCFMAVGCSNALSTALCMLYHGRQLSRWSAGVSLVTFKVGPRACGLVGCEVSRDHTVSAWASMEIVADHQCLWERGYAQRVVCEISFSARGRSEHMG